MNWLLSRITGAALPYVLGGMLAALLATGGYALWQRGEAADARAEIEKMVAAQAVALHKAADEARATEARLQTKVDDAERAYGDEAIKRQLAENERDAARAVAADDSQWVRQHLPAVSACGAAASAGAAERASAPDLGRHLAACIERGDRLAEICERTAERAATYAAGLRAYAAAWPRAVKP